MSREYVLKTYIDQVKNKYDYVIIDCRPSLSMITLNALACSDSVIIPVQAHYLSAKGMTQLIQTINKVRKRINPNLKIDGVLITLADMQTKVGKMAGQSLFTYDKNSKPAIAYQNFCKEVLKIEKQRTRNEASYTR